MRRGALTWLSVLALAGCEGVEEPGLQPLPGDDDDEPTPEELPVAAPHTPDDWRELPPCETTPTLSTEQEAAEPLGLLHVTATGGTGDYVLSMIGNGSGAIFEPSVGVYIAGEVFDTTDVLHVRDRGCLGESTLDIDVVPKMRLTPVALTLPPGDGFQYDVDGGSGVFAFTETDLRSDGTLTEDGLYEAGPSEGLDELFVTDLRTGVVIEALANVDAAASLAPRPGALFVPVGTELDLVVDGGSGILDATADAAGIVTLSSGDPPTILASASGEVTITLDDRYSSLATEITVEVVASLEATFERTGHNTMRSLAIGPGDLNDDGFPDAIFGSMEADYAAHRSGAVYVYAGGPNGLEPTPARVISYAHWYAEMAESVAVTDLDGDGVKELVVGVPRHDMDRSDQGLGPWEDTGAVQVYAGVPGAFFSDEPTQVVLGSFGSDHFGKSVAACDVNGDGVPDLAVGSRYAEDRTRNPISYTQGKVSIFLGIGDGTFPEEPSQELWGAEPDGSGGWMPDPGQEFGFDMAGGDYDGDGLCDLAVVGNNWASGSGRSRDNLITLFRGQSDDSNGAPPEGGVIPVPVKAWAPVDPENDNSYFGRELGFADLNGDTLDDLIVGHYRYTAPTGGPYNGAVRVYGGETLGVDPASGVTPAAEHDWIHAGNSSWDYVGLQFDVSDVDGDGLLDLITGDAREEISGSETNAGLVSVFRGQPGTWPETTPVTQFVGTESDGRFGTSVAALGDVDGDGVTDLFAHASFEDLYGRDVGVPWYLPGLDPLNTPVALEVPGEAAGQRFGEAAALVGDVNDDGFEDALVGGFESGSMDQLKSGSAWLYLGTAAGLPSTPDLVLHDFTGNSSNDRFGYDVASAGDFDGDGVNDFAVVSRYEDKPTNFGAGWNDPGDCLSGSNGDVGGVFVFLGAAAGGVPSSEPAFVIYGPQRSQRVDSVDSGDFNGDGLGDIVFGGYDWDRTGATGSGGVNVVLGRAWSGSGIDAICSYDLEMRGANTYYRMGRAVAALGDLDGDGCDEFATAGYEADWTATNEGAVHVVRGWGGSCPADPAQVVLTPRDSYDRAGYSLGGGGDFDGDGVPDLAVGAPWHSTSSATRGSAWVVPGDWILQLPFAPIDDDGPSITWPFWPLPGSMASDWRIQGTAYVGYTGWSVDLVPGAAGGLAALAVGEPRADQAQVEWSGGARLFGYRPAGETGSDGIEPEPFALFTGEGSNPNGWAGKRVSGGTVGGAPALLIGAPQSNALGLDNGAAWVLGVDP